MPENPEKKLHGDSFDSKSSNDHVIRKLRSIRREIEDNSEKSIIINSEDVLIPKLIGITEVDTTNKNRIAHVWGVDKATSSLGAFAKEKHSERLQKKIA